MFWKRVEAFKAVNIPSVKYGGSSIVVLGYVVAHGIGYLHFFKEIIVKKIEAKILMKGVPKKGKEFQKK